MPKSLSQAQKEAARQDKQAEAAARKKEEKAARDALLKAGSRTTAEPTAPATKPTPAAASTLPFASLPAGTLSAVKLCLARLYNQKSKLCAQTEEVVLGDTAAAGSDTALATSTTFDVIDCHHASITFVDGARSQRLSLTLPPKLLSTSESLRACLAQAVQPKAVEKQHEEHKVNDEHEVAKLEREQARKASMQSKHEAQDSARTAARQAEHAKQQARKAQIQGALSREESLAHGVRNLAIVNGEKRGKYAMR